jgi:hypothetical protein
MAVPTILATCNFISVIPAYLLFSPPGEHEKVVVFFGHSAALDYT